MKTWIIEQLPLLKRRDTYDTFQVHLVHRTYITCKKKICRTRAKINAISHQLIKILDHLSSSLSSSSCIYIANCSTHIRTANYCEDTERDEIYIDGSDGLMLYFRLKIWKIFINFFINSMYLLRKHIFDLYIKNRDVILFNFPWDN